MYDMDKERQKKINRGKYIFFFFLLFSTVKVRVHIPYMASVKCLIWSHASYCNCLYLPLKMRQIKWYLAIVEEICNRYSESFWFSYRWSTFHVDIWRLYRFPLHIPTTLCTLTNRNKFQVVLRRRNKEMYHIYTCKFLFTLFSLSHYLLFYPINTLDVVVVVFWFIGD